MLAKLIKHEFRATAKYFGILFLVVIGTSILAGVSFILLERTDIVILNLIGSLCIAAFVIAMFGANIAALVIMITRFQRNLLSDEGYLSFSLPVSVHGHIWAKLIVSTLWYLATFAVSALAMFLAFTSVMSAISPTDWQQFTQQLYEVFPNLDAALIANGIGYMLEMLVFVLLCCFGSCLLFYAAMATGYGFPRHKAGMSVLFFFVFQFVTQIMGFAPFMVSVGSSQGSFAWLERMAPTAQIHVVLWVMIVAVAVYCAIFYVVTWLNLQKRLNLE